ncbi:complex III assembly factor LYRM7 [Chelonus insularis]|uniref:complex III assembly factor LYRM7 n=1 Tax=Chelonus insularis TaxID=460826 RepID=UPI00158C6A85|nr:complex III assembly factor LYRM7 [Chelonus insularis]
MNGRLRGEVLRTFKKLHKTRKIIFQGDERALSFVRNKINDEFKKNKHVTDEKSIEELNKLALEVDHELKTTVIQAIEKKPGTYELNIRKDHLIDNTTLPLTSFSKSNRKCSSKGRESSNGKL